MERNKSLETEGGDEVKALVNKLPEYKVPEGKKGTQESGWEGELAVQESIPKYTNPVVAKDIVNIDRATSHAPVSWMHLLKQKSIMHIFVLQMTSKSLYIERNFKEKKFNLHKKYKKIDN